MASFNLVDQPWIPCMLRGELQPRELGLRETLDRAVDIQEVVHPSPLVSVSIFRLLLAIAHRTHGPATEHAWHAIWDAGELNSDALHGYFERCADRFDLFSDTHPFFQTPDVDYQYASPAWRLSHELGPANRPMFAGIDKDNVVLFSPAQGAQYLVAYQSFSPGGLLTYDDPKHKSAKGAPLSRGAVAVITGPTLFHTLLLNLVRYDPSAGEPIRARGDDMPAWERDRPTQAGDREPDGYLDWLTWQSRRIRLEPRETSEGNVVVQRAVLMQGYQLPKGVYVRDFETMLAYKTISKPVKGQEPYSVVGFRADRAVWRDSQVLFQTSDKGQRPKTVDWVATVEPGGNRAPRQQLHMYGMCGDQFNVLFWRHERLPLPMAFLTVRDLYDYLPVALGIAEDVARALNAGARKMAELLLAPGSGQQEGRSADPDAARALVESWAPGRTYWSQLGEHFGRYLIEQAQEHALHEADEEGYDSEALVTWARRARSTSWEALRTITNSMDTDGRSLHAMTRAEYELGWRLRHLWQERAVLQGEVHESADTA